MNFRAACVLLFCLGLTALNLHAKDLTAFDLVAAGNQYVSDVSKNHVVQIRSEKSVGSLVPEVWYVVYYDPSAALKAVEVKFGAGKMLEVKHPMRLLEPMRGDQRVLDSDKLKIDSDRALAIALKEPLLKNISLKAAQFWLEHGDLGPRWRIRLWAAKLYNPTKLEDIGQIFIAADNGQVIKEDLHLDRLD